MARLIVGFFCVQQNLWEEPHRNWTPFFCSMQPSLAPGFSPGPNLGKHVVFFLGGIIAARVLAIFFESFNFFASCAKLQYRRFWYFLFGQPMQSWDSAFNLWLGHHPKRKRNLSSSIEILWKGPMCSKMALNIFLFFPVFIYTLQGTDISPEKSILSRWFSFSQGGIWTNRSLEGVGTVHDLHMISVLPSPKKTHGWQAGILDVDPMAVSWFGKSCGGAMSSGFAPAVLVDR